MIAAAGVAGAVKEAVLRPIAKSGIGSLLPKPKRVDFTAAAYPQHNIARPITGDNIIISFGQSLVTGSEGWPPLTTTAPFADVLQLGAGLGGSHAEESDWASDGIYRPLIAWTRNDDATGYLEHSDFELLDPTTQRDGEAPGHALAYSTMGRLIRAKALPPGARIVAIQAGRGGQPLRVLEGGFYGRFTGAVSDAMAVSATEGRVAQVSAILWIQGDAEFGGQENDRQRYAAKLSALFRRLQSDVQQITGQAHPPAILAFQFSGPAVWNKDRRGRLTLPIPNACIDACDAVDGAYLVGPYYQVTNKKRPGSPSHLDPNGYRWIGEYAARVFEVVVTRGRDWQPLRPLRVRQYSQSLIVDYHVPAPPLRLNAYLDNHEEKWAPNYGFRVRDAAGDCGIAFVELHERSVTISLTRPTLGRVYLFYGDKAAGGAGNLCDSDEEVGLSTYSFVSGRGQPASANIAALVDKPYPLPNWAVAGCWPAAAG